MLVENARKVSFGAGELRNVVGTATMVYAARGKKIVSFDLTEDSVVLDDAGKSLLGPTGNLRAPALRFGSIFVVGFNEELYTQLLRQ